MLVLFLLQLRAFFYLGSVTSRDDETQRKGVVIVQHNLDTEFATRSAIHGLGRVLRALPLRVASIHTCVDDMVEKAAAMIASLLIGSDNTVRVRAHCGTDMECQYELMTFGLNVKFPLPFPISPSGDVDLTGHIQFLQQRKVEEQLDGPIYEVTDSVSELSLESSGRDTTGMASMELDAMVDFEMSVQRQKSTVVVPGEFDIILGRGKGYQNHKGNIRYRHIVETKRPVYETLPTKKEKTQLIRDLVKSIYDEGGRFLRQDSIGRWVPIDQDSARDKVSHSFRNQKRLSKIKSDQADGGGTTNRIHVTEREDRDAKRARNLVDE
jgi:hypothetical protein